MESKEKVTDSEIKRQEDLKKYCPIFESDITPDFFEHEKAIRFVYDDPRQKEEACKGSIGFYTVTKDRKMPTFYTQYLRLFGLDFYPLFCETVYIADPCIPKKYIHIEEYFNYMKDVRVNELTVIAQSLGAKHVVIALNSSDKTSHSENMEANVSASDFVKAKGERKRSSEKKQSVKIWSDTRFKTSIFNGSTEIPQVLYFRNESDISSLIKMVTENKSKITTRTYSMQASSSAGMSQSDAISISGALKAVKCGAAAELEKRAAEESKSVLEYTIEF